MKVGSTRELTLIVEFRVLPIFFHFLQDGFLLEAQFGCSVREFLRERCRFSPETISEKIKTVFLDGKPVDDLDHALIGGNSTLALSGAMPGLVGAVMRTNSPLRSFRSSITHGGDETSAEPQLGLVRLKLFNTVMSEFGPALLREGILLEPSDVRGFLVDALGKHEDGLVNALLDREPIDWALLRNEDLFAESDLVALSAKVRE